ncbi:MAG: hypothetical protein ACFFKA_01650, partial [Candidatus Thorarchaeota archaeon]
MLKTYIFNDLESNWIEEKNSLLKHDLCVVLDDEHSMIYLWRGPKSSKDKHIKAINALNLLIESRPELNIKLNEKEQKFPPQVRKTIQNLLKAKENDIFHSKYIFSRFITIRVYLLMLIISISLPLISLLNLGSFISWIPSGSNFIVLTETYNTWLIISVILTIITIFIFSFSIMIGIL